MSYAQLRVLACCRYHFHFDFVIMEHVSNLLEEASHLLRSQGCLETSQADCHLETTQAGGRLETTQGATEPPGYVALPVFQFYLWQDVFLL